uniref:Uncharacterized protein n=1 Tax=Anguilla anguilla TaxID=7936 RepID=A0A0E9W8V6_ANGAN
MRCVCKYICCTSYTFMTNQSMLIYLYNSILNHVRWRPTACRVPVFMLTAITPCDFFLPGG